MEKESVIVLPWWADPDLRQKNPALFAEWNANERLMWERVLKGDLNCDGKQEC